MQPYFFPYIGYFQLINAVDEFVIYDIIEYSKGGWINRNRILVNNKDAYITLPIKKDSDFLDVRDRYLADTWPVDRKKMLNRIKESYKKAPYFNEVYPLVEKCILYEESNLFKFVFHSICAVKDYLDISTSFVVASSIDIDHSLTSENKVIRICEARNANKYINPIGGINLYSKENFKKKGIDLQFLKTKDINYKQYCHDHIPYLSIIDVLMFNTRGVVNKYIQSSYDIIE